VGVAAVAALVVICAWVVAASQLPSLGAGALLHPVRRHVQQSPPAGCEEATFHGAGVMLAGWRCGAVGERRASLVFLHGVGDNRAGVTGLLPRFMPRGFDVIAYDSRAHGESGGDACTYGFWEKQDLRAVIDVLRPGPVVLLGTSLGGAVALQEAAAIARAGPDLAEDRRMDRHCPRKRAVESGDLIPGGRRFT
jgi:uncharacterized protein